MASRNDSKRWNLGRNPLAVGLLVLLPGFMFVGLLAPGAVTVNHEEQKEALAAEPPVFRPMRSFKLPLLAPRDFSTRGVRDVVDLAPLFQIGEHRGLDAQNPPGFESIPGDVIVLAEVAETAEGEGPIESVADDLEESPETNLLTVDLTALWDSAIFDVIPPPLPLDPNFGFTQYDDFPGFGLALVALQAPVPEPSTGALLALGVALLAARRKRR